MGFHSGFHSGSLFHHLRFTAKIRDIIAIFDDNLVTTTTKSQFHGDPGRFGSMRIRIRIDTDTDTDSYRHLISDIYRFYFFQNIKFFLF